MEYKKHILQIKKMFTARRIKIGMGFFAACIIVAGAVAWYIHQQKIERQTQLRMAQTRMVEYQAQQRNLPIITIEQARALAAKAIGKDESSLTFEKLFLKNKWDDKYRSVWENWQTDYNDDLHSYRSGYDQPAENLSAILPEQERTLQKRQNYFFPVYEITCYSGFLEYELEIDAWTGDILDSEVESRFWD